jgi:hypothetical protein
MVRLQINGDYLAILELPATTQFLRQSLCLVAVSK